MQPVDSWALTRTYPATDDDRRPPLWLESITRTGKDGDRAVVAAAGDVLRDSAGEPGGDRDRT